MRVDVVASGQEGPDTLSHIRYPGHVLVGKGDSPLLTRQIAGSLTASIAYHRQSKRWPRCPEIPSRAPVVSEIQQVRSRVAVGQSQVDPSWVATGRSGRLSPRRAAIASAM